MRNLVIAFVLSIVGLVAGCGVDDPSERFVGSYNTTLTLSGQGSATMNDSLSISAGSTSDLIFNSQHGGAIRVSIHGSTSFTIDQQQIMLTAQNGQAFSVTIQGQGTIVDGVFNATGTLSDASGSLAFTWAGSKL